MLPGGDACNPSGTSRIYSINLGTGQSDLLAADGTTTIAYSSAVDGVATEQRSYGVEDNGKFKRVLVVGNSKGGAKGVSTKQPMALGLRRLNWRELPLAN